MRAIIKLSVVIIVAISLQCGLQALASNAAEAGFECEVLWARLRDVPIDAPQLLDLAEPFIGVVARPHGGEMSFVEESLSFTN